MDTKKLLKNRTIYCVAIFAVSLFFFGYSNASAAISYFSPSSGNITVGNIFTVNILVNTEGVTINNAEAVISFPKDLLEIVSVGKSGSIFSLWVEEPAFSNSAGTLSFNGGVPTPGFNGAAGKILSVVFRVKNGGSASLVFSSTTVRANDGYGTNVFKTGVQASFNLISEGKAVSSEEKLSPTPSVAPVVGGLPAAPQISSPTHPDQEKWYSNNNPKFIWKLSSDVTAVRILYDKFSTSRPTVIYKPPISEKQLENIKDGIWYFHAQFNNAKGWSDVVHFRIQVDTERPISFNITEVPREDNTAPKVKFIFDAKDETSGIDHYEIKIDGGDPEIWGDSESHQYETSIVSPGKHTLLAKAIDKAGNSLASSIEFTVEVLVSPTIIDYQKELQSGEPLIIHGSTYPNSKVNVWLQKENDNLKSFTIESDRSGEFIFTDNEKLSDGVYKLWVEVIDGRGARSLPSGKITISITESAVFRIGNWAISFLAVVVPLVALIIMLLLLLWYGWYKFSFMRKRLRKEVREVESALHKSFELLKEDIRTQVKTLERARTKRQLTEEEEKIIKQLKRDLDGAEEIIREEIEDIEKEVK